MKLLMIFLFGLASAQKIISDTHFYGQSPPVYPSPEGAGLGDWKAPYAKAKKLVSKLSIDEKTKLTAGVRTINNGCGGNIPPIERVGFPGMCFQDAGQGVRATNLVNAYASGISVGASWNKDLAKERSEFMHKEFKAKGANVALGPAIGAAGRVVTNGRLWEGFSVDPYLAGVLGAETVKGARSVGVITSAKHYILNEQETSRIPQGEVEAISSNVDDKTMHELYLWPFQDAVRAGTGNIMCSYQRVNNSYGCANSKTLNGLLKTELGFQGFVVTDWNAQHAGVATALAGLDVAMPDSPFWGTNLTTAIRNGSVPESRLDDMATRVLATWYYAGQDQDFPPPGVGLPKDLKAPHKRVNARDPASKNTLFQGAVQGHVLVKNDGALPLKKPEVINLFGYGAKAPNLSGPSGASTGWSAGFQAANATDFLLAVYEGFRGPATPIAQNGTIVSGGGSGANAPAYISTPFEALSQRAYEDHSVLSWDFESWAPQVAADPDVCIVVINAFGSEVFDRATLADERSDSLVNSVADQCSNTVVVIQNVGTRLVDRFADHPNVTAIVYTHMPGQDAGRALVALLYGDENFSGRLPYTVAREESDYGNLLRPSMPEGDYEMFPQSNFEEGAFIDYRDFAARSVRPRYEFGFGLSYTTFEFRNLGIRVTGDRRSKPYPTGKVLPGGPLDLWDTLVKITADITNTGSVRGQEVVQLYVERTDGGLWLRGFDKVDLAPGETRKVVMELNRRDLSDWDVVAQKWKLSEGSVRVHVGASVLDLRLDGSFDL
ncbi:related to Probable beta-glucosidase M [Cephalotrichum gorgonifer]|uniref:Beta-glucosidase cel3A n=1 Tax=Cephalotrichum gorgonifer TaxID=2041049 RepID=A0AAE8SYY2_9PEZI|nr:related to Probable beta-glucosidase M [Cephalotrichum gorgonifer]